MHPNRSLTLLIALFVMIGLFLWVGCTEGDDDDDDDDENIDDDDLGDDDTGGIYDDDDMVDDDDDDDDFFPPPETNPNARADAFRLFYRERTERVLLALNRFGVSGDAVFANCINKNLVQKTGDVYEVVPGPNDNNPIGVTAWVTWKLYQAIGGRPLELTLIRLFEGLVFSEQVSGHPGITCRESLPGWTRVMDGVNDEITRTRFGEPFDSPMPYPEELEQEILDTFYDGLIFTYRENPEEYFWNFKAINEYEQFALTLVHHELPDFLRVSDCCSSFKRTPEGYLWEGAYWANHNSRDNFTDYAMGYLAAMEAVQTKDLPEDLAEAAQRALDAGIRIGNQTVDAGMILMTVDEWHDYQTLVPAGQQRPDGHVEIESQDLGSLASCTMVYTAQALSTEGLSYPVPVLPMPGDPINQGLQHLFDLLGIPIQVPVRDCDCIDDSFLGFTWLEILEMEVFGMPWYEFAELVAMVFPDLLTDLLGGTADDFKEMMLGAVCLCYYADIVDDEELLIESKSTLRNLVNITYILTDLVYGIKQDPYLWGIVVDSLGEEVAEEKFSNAEKLYYLAALYGRMYDLDTPVDYFGNFDLANSRIESVEKHLTYGDTTPRALMTDQELWDKILDPDDGRLWKKEWWIQERYLNRFGYTAPVRRAGDGYEVVGPDWEWQPTENDRHRWFGHDKMWHEAMLCNTSSPHTLDCYWAKLGCAPADLDDSGTADESDLALFDAAWAEFGEGASCSGSNGWCDGADLDKNGVLDDDDQGFMNAAQGCVR